ncbi:glycerophosphodiester phosphodiesterase family protein [Yoonia sediminilitoris]|uniref:Glycerophosphoryl diester phosphodiesterase n=1 Tax=Yoonia sediminilitoris TaxID=1286148 RepID=A0A2T6KII1_9RHOB|nr:glycerophosphodiester phosphodiesterase family protein [Yoonia sediminilitoris]PUB15525.1 glycerophosphoryl diester phosphodiesterase [Yoonia sediminilitoris]RCW96134.1 glycerophosphoryl diester phosphodiesterase [Yoonia sediminilitoris]
MTLPTSFFARPITHRGLHDRKAGRVENSVKSFQAAIDAGYGIELDLQLSSDGHAMVFHDDLLDRLTSETGPVCDRTRAELEQVALTDDGSLITALDDVLTLVSGRVPLLIEIKDQDGAMGADVGTLEAATVAALDGYSGDVALMSFNPHAVAAVATLAPHIPRGIVTSSYAPKVWPEVPPERQDELRDIPDFGPVGACFISHEASDLDRPRVAELKAQGAHILCWTIRSPQAEAKARKIADNVTFEGYLA